MAFSFKREIIGNGIGFSEIISPIFKTNSVRIQFNFPLSPETYHDNSVAGSILGCCNSKYPTIAEFSKKLNTLYGAGIYSESGRNVDTQYICTYMNTIDDKFALEGEKLFDDTLDVNFDCIFSPETENGEFENSIFSFKKKDAVDSLEAEINDKRNYALIKASQIAYRGEISHLKEYSEKEGIEKVTPESAYEKYQDVLKNSQIEVFYVGAEPNPELKEKIKSVFSYERNVPICNYRSFSPLKPEPEYVTERMKNVLQSKMVMVFKSENTDFFAMYVLNAIFGGSTTSKLFSNVREKMSLCYYCASRYNQGKGSLIVDSGIEEQNIEKAETEILRQFENIKNGDFTDDEINSAVLFLVNAYNSITDSAGSLIAWYLKQITDGGEILSPAETAERIKAVTRERIIEAAKSFTLDTVYVLTAEKEEEE